MQGNGKRRLLGQYIFYGEVKNYTYDGDAFGSVASDTKINFLAHMSMNEFVTFEKKTQKV